jgi:hypothetical protein
MNLRDATPCRRATERAASAPRTQAARSKLKKRRKLTAEEKRQLYLVESNAGIGWDYPKYKRSHFNPAYRPTDPRRFEGDEQT